MYYIYYYMRIYYLKDIINILIEKRAFYIDDFVERRKFYIDGKRKICLSIE